MRVHAHARLEEIKTGKFVSISGSQHKFFALITDLALEVSQPDIVRFPPAEHEKFLQQTLVLRDMYALARLRPMLMITHDNKVMQLKQYLPILHQFMMLNALMLLVFLVMNLTQAKIILQLVHHLIWMHLYA